MRDRGRRGVVFVGARARSPRGSPAPGCITGLTLMVDVVVHAHHPRSTHEQVRGTGRPARMCGAGHRVAADESVEQPVLLNLLQHIALTLTTSVSGQSGAVSMCRA